MRRLALVVLSLAGVAFAESFFSARGLGEEWGMVDARTFGLYTLGPTNPAYGINFLIPTFSATFLTEYLNGRENHSSRNIGDFVPMNVMGFMPLPFDFGFRVGLAERFNQDFSVYSDSIVTGTTSYQRHIVGKGGVYGATFGAGKNLFKHLTLGADYTWFFGSSVEEWGLKVYEGGYVTKDTTDAVFSGYNFKLGGSLQTQLFTLNGLWETPIGLNVASELHSVAKTETASSRFRTPSAWGLGLSINGPKNTRLFFDYRNQPWAGSNPSLGFTNGATYAAGLELKRVPITIGYRNRSWPVLSVMDKKISEQAIFVKSSLPISYWGDFHFGVEFLQRGDGSLTETGLRLMTSLSFEEPWKRRHRRWGGG
jgi:hypothetical protein